MSEADAPDPPGPGPAFAIQRHELDPGTCLLVIEGELDIASTAVLREQLHQPLAAGYQRIVLDLEEVSFIDSSALGVLVGINYERRLVAGEGLVMAGLRPSVLKVLEVTGLISSFDITPDVQSALAHARDESEQD